MSTRRHFLQYGAGATGALCGLGGVGDSSWFSAFAAQAATAAAQNSRHCILLWMSGGPAQTDTFDLKPGHANGGEFREIDTKTPGLRWSEHLPKLAQHSEHLAVLRGLSTGEGDHGRGTYLMRTGHPPLGPVAYPSIGASLSHELEQPDRSIPGYVSIGAFRALNPEAFGSGFLGARYSPLYVAASDMPGSVVNNSQGFAELRVQSLDPIAGITDARRDRRLALWQGLQNDFLSGNRGAAARSHHTVYEGALRLMNSREADAFQLSKETVEDRDRYGRGAFGQGCLLARRLVERGVSFVEVSLGTSSGGVGWDTHVDGFNSIKTLSAELDAGWSALIADLKDRGLLESTTILWMGEFGRTPRINTTAGRDHYPDAWSAVLAGGGIAGGQVYGRTSDDGQSVVDGQVSAGDLLSTLCRAVGLPPRPTLTGPEGRPIPIAEGTPIQAVLS
ncbi:DUF1501 domain-containing protein [bacterium]|nr:DUF1501 domain-containing protein [bacterium]